VFNIGKQVPYIEVQDIKNIVCRNRHEGCELETAGIKGRSFLHNLTQVINV
jgi:hypothetical protein